MSDIHSKRAASRSPHPSEKRDPKRPDYKQFNNLLSDAEHRQYDEQANFMVEVVGSVDNTTTKALAGLLSCIVAYCPPHASMNPIYKEPKKCTELLEAHPYLVNMLQHAVKIGSYKEFRNLGVSIESFSIYQIY